MAKEVVIRISAQDAASPVFKRLSGEAASMGASIETSTQRSGRSFEDFNKKAAAVGASIGAATMILGDFARAAAEEEAGMARLQQAVENTGKSYDEYSTAIDTAIKRGQDLSFADDQVVDGLAALTTTTGSATEALDQIGLAMDVARTRGISLTDAATLVGKVHEGNIGILSRYGIAVEEGATAQEALALLQQRTAGQAETYAETTEGSAVRIKNAFDNITESIGAHTGGLQELLILLPGITAGYTALSGVVAGMGGFGALARFAGPAALVAGGASLAYGYSQDTNGSTATNDFWNNFFLQGSNVMNSLLPGNPYDTKKYTDQMDSNQLWDAINQVVRGGGESQDVALQRVVDLLSIPGGYVDPNYYQGRPPGADTSKYIPPSKEDVEAYVRQQAAAMGLSVSGYISSEAASDPRFVFDPVIQSYVTRSEYSDSIQSRATSYVGSPGTSGLEGAVPVDPYNGRPTYDPYGYGNIREFDPERLRYLEGGGGAVANSTYLNWKDPVVLSPEMQQAKDATELEAYNAALEKQLGLYYPLVEGINSANDAQGAFWQTQQYVLQGEAVYSQQLGEYTSQVNAQDAAYEILNERRNEGIALSDAETEFMNNYAEANERGTGAIEDATIAQGLLAQQYLLNMEKGDALNDTLSGNTDATRDLVDVVYELILSLEGIPPEVRTRIEIERAQESLGELQGIAFWLNSLDNFTAHAYVNVQQTGIAIGNPDGPSLLPGAMNGITAYANGGTVYEPLMPRFADGGTWAMVGERGPELRYLARGDQIYNTEATKSMTNRGQGRPKPTVAFYGPVTIAPNTEANDVFRGSVMGDVW